MAQFAKEELSPSSLLNPFVDREAVDLVLAVPIWLWYPLLLPELLPLEDDNFFRPKVNEFSAVRRDEAADVDVERILCVFLGVMDDDELLPLWLVLVDLPRERLLDKEPLPDCNEGRALPLVSEE